MSRVYFTDRDLGKQFPQILAEVGISVERHADLYPPDGSDEQWLEYCGASGRVAISHNSRIRYVPNQIAAGHDGLRTAISGRWPRAASRHLNDAF